MRYFIVKTDHHIVEPNHPLSKVDTAARAKAVVAKILEERVPIDFIVDTGDVCDSISTPVREEAEATSQSYEHALSILGPINEKSLYIAGNHDCPALMYEILGDRWDSNKNGVMVKQSSGVTLVGVDLRIGTSAIGMLRPESAQELRAELARAKKVILFSHYLWRPTDCDFVEREIRVSNGAEMADILRGYKEKILGAFHGHLHVWWSGSHAGIPLYGGAGSAFGFDLEPGSVPFAIDPTRPLGYYLVGLGDDGSLLVRPRFI